ncbi:MAG: VanZ family protein, partial [Verrucomicrobia bacterium]|nr:VanZ family protein [Verrucomicrobiota bacterium]
LASADSRGWRWWPALATLMAAGLCATIDEWHQTFVPSRTGSARDVAIDVAGATLALLLLRLAFFLRRRAQPRATAVAA